jgi:hypothetical protein
MKVTPLTTPILLGWIVAVIFVALAIALAARVSQDFTEPYRWWVEAFPE